MRDPSADEAALWAAALAQDGTAFGRLFDLHRDAVFRQALRLTASPADAEEVAASAFFELWRKRESVRLVAGSVLPWLLVTAANLSRNSRRSLVRRERLLRRAPREHDDAAARAFARIDDDLPRSALVAALRRLPPGDAALVTMAALEGYRVAEIAELLGLTENAARVRLHRAHKKLRGLLAPTDTGRTETQEVAR
ncbi:sigma-70 family RNA polymerase sigma factor [Amnibacterium soli]|uniref:Sigma-70 family RNA polymerase sigma factor n=1 Tax=Amnibacterium soli TaxID=1282736 RepID=A0ABP8ZIV7_9MICO